ncbi:hypothetical protein Tco_0973427 [Tanacetum coccineum]
MATLAEFMIISNADNRPPMLEKSLYDSWESRMELYIDNRENRRMILSLLLNGPLVWPTVVEEDGTTRTKKYEEIFVAEKLQADCDLKATNIVLQGLPPDVYAISHQTSSVLPIAYNTPQSLTQRLTEFPQIDSGLVVPVFNQGDYPIACLNKAMAFLTVVASSRFPSTNNQLRTSSNPRNQATIQDGRVTVQQVQGRQGQSYDGNSYLPTEDLMHIESDYDDVSNAKAVLMDNLSNYGSDIISEVHHFKPNHTDMDNHSVHAMQCFEQTPVVDFTDNEITSDSNIISSSQYLQETQQTNVQDNNLYAQQDSMILSVIEQMSEQMINHVYN